MCVWAGDLIMQSQLSIIELRLIEGRLLQYEYFTFLILEKGRVHMTYLTPVHRGDRQSHGPIDGQARFEENYNHINDYPDEDRDMTVIDGVSESGSNMTFMRKLGQQSDFPSSIAETNEGFDIDDYGDDGQAADGGYIRANAAAECRAPVPHTFSKQPPIQEDRTIESIENIDI